MQSRERVLGGTGSASPEKEGHGAARIVDIVRCGVFVVS